VTSPWERMYTINSTSWWLADSSDFELVGSKVPENGRFPAKEAVRFLVFINGSQSKRSYVVAGVLILNIYMLLDGSNSGRVCTLAPMLC